MNCCGNKRSLTRQIARLGADLLLGVILVVTASPAVAVDIQTFVPYADNNPTVSVLGASAFEPGECWLGGFANHVRRPLPTMSQGESEEQLVALSALSVAPSCGITANLGLLASVPVYWVESKKVDAGARFNRTPRIGDSSLALRWTVVPRTVPYTGRSIALVPVAKLGRANTSPFDGPSPSLGSDGPITGGLKVVYDHYITPQNYFAANFDYAHRREQLLAGHKLGPEWRFGFGYSYMIEPLSGLSAFAEWQGRRSFASRNSAELGVSMDAQAGLSAKPIGDRLGMFIGAGRGLGDGYGYGSPAARFFAGIELTVSKVSPPAKPFVESEIPPPELNSKDPGSLRLNLRDSKRKDIAFSLRGGSALSARSGTVMGGGPFFQSMSPGIYTLDVKATGYSKRSEQLVISPGVTSLVEVTPRARGEIAITLRLEVPPIQFETKKAVIKTQSFADLDRLAKILSDNDLIQVLAIEGHTDNVGARDRNIKLSLARANAVQSYLTAKGVNLRRLITKGFGPDDPIVSNDSESGRSRNRRVEFVIQAVKPAG